MLLFLTNLLLVSCIRLETPNLRPPVFTSIKGPATITDIPAVVTKQSLVSNILLLANVEETKSFLIGMTEFPDRYFKSNSGVAAAEWIVSVF